METEAIKRVLDNQRMFHSGGVWEQHYKPEVDAARAALTALEIRLSDSDKNWETSQSLLNAMGMDLLKAEAIVKRLRGSREESDES